MPGANRWIRPWLTTERRQPPSGAAIGPQGRGCHRGVDVVLKALMKRGRRAGRGPGPWRRLVAVLGGVCLLAPWPSAADVQRPLPLRTDLAAVRDMEIEVVRGQTVVIMLSATVPTTQTPTFILRSQPGAGRLGDLERVPGEPLQARISYTVPADSTATEDRFTFAARLGGGPMSAAAEVRIRIRDPMPVLDGGSLVMEQVPVGHEQIGSLTLVNRGDGPWRGVLRLPAPWRGPEGQVEVPPGSQVEVPVWFAPPDLETYRHEFLLQEDRPDSKVLLVGRGVPSFSLNPGRRLVLGLDQASGERRGRLVVQGRADMSLKLASDAAARLGLPDQLQLVADEPVELMLRLASDDMAVLATRIEAASDFMTASVEVVADPVPGRLRIEPLPEDRVVELGELRAGRQATFSLGLVNEGGTGLRLRFEAERPAFVVEPAGTVELAPGDRLQLTAGIRPTTPGSIERRISIDTGAGIESVLVRADVDAPDTEPADVVVPRMGSGPVTWDDLMAAGEGGRALGDWATAAMADGVRLSPVEMDEALPRVETVAAVASGRRWVELNWLEPEQPGANGGAGFDYVIELSRVMPHPESGLPGHFWVPVADVDVQWRPASEGGVVKARLVNQPQGSPVVARVAVLGADGSMGPVSPPAGAVTRGAWRFPWRTAGHVLLLVTGGTLGYVVWRQRQAR